MRIDQRFTTLDFWGPRRLFRVAGEEADLDAVVAAEEEEEMEMDSEAREEESKPNPIDCNPRM